MNQILGLMRDTWMFWAGFLVVAVICGLTIDIAFFAAIPLSAITIAYFAAVRYDEHGRPKK
jgi:hypothetical protein